MQSHWIQTTCIYVLDNALAQAVHLYALFMYAVITQH